MAGKSIPQVNIIRTQDDYFEDEPGYISSIEILYPATGILYHDSDDDSDVVEIFNSIVITSAV